MLVGVTVEETGLMTGVREIREGGSQEGIRRGRAAGRSDLRDL